MRAEPVQKVEAAMPNRHFQRPQQLALNSDNGSGFV
jgi:hypothetical protein